MAELVKRVQVLLEQDEYDWIKRLSIQEHKSIGAMVREALNKTYRRSKEDRLKALERLFRKPIFDEPVDWEKEKSDGAYYKDLP